MERSDPIALLNSILREVIQSNEIAKQTADTTKRILQEVIKSNEVAQYNTETTKCILQEMVKANASALLNADTAQKQYELARTLGRQLQ